VFENCIGVDEIVVVTGADEIPYVSEILSGLNKVKMVVAGGSERQYSVYNGLKAIEACDIVLIHDGVRPFVGIADIEKCIEETRLHGACVLGVPVKDTIKLCDENGVVQSTPKRSLLWAAQTPQCFKYELILKAYERVIGEGLLCTDDASVAELCGITVKMVQGSYNNIKITTPEDLVMGEAIIKSKI
jgi:2-C-methyl-D-erythritol 4-phosphate cytidylyltransferase